MTAILATKLRSCVQLSCHDAEASRRRVRRSERSTSIPNNVGGELPRKCKGRPRKPLAEVILKCAPLRATSSGKNTMRKSKIQAGREVCNSTSRRTDFHRLLLQLVVHVHAFGEVVSPKK